MISKLTVQLLTFNGAKYIGPLFGSLKNQTYLDWELVILDNNSSDDTLTKIKKELSDFKIKYQLIEGKNNLGFAGGHNFLFSQTAHRPYTVLLNQDMYLEKDCLEKLVAFMDEQPAAGAASAKLLKWDFANLEFTTQIDSLGLRIFRNRRIVDLVKIEAVNGESDTRALAVFGVSGALPIYRQTALEKVKFADGNIFDESYFMYKEDVDLAWRLQSAGFGAFIVPSAIAYHDRTASGPRELNDSSARVNKKTQSDFVQFYSYKNHLATLIKNERLADFLRDAPFILFYELKKIVWYLFCNPKVLRGLSILFSKQVWQKRLSPKSAIAEIGDIGEIRRWWMKNQIYDYSAGAIVFSPDKKSVLLIHQKHGDFIGFPKGHLNKNESAIDAARRECLEEAGVNIEILSSAPIGRMFYSFVLHNIFWHKQVDFFVGLAKDMSITSDQGEVVEAKFVPIKEALRILTHEEAKQILCSTFPLFL